MVLDYEKITTTYGVDKVMLVAAVAVSPKHRGNGIGRELNRRSLQVRKIWQAYFFFLHSGEKIKCSEAEQI